MEIKHHHFLEPSSPPSSDGTSFMLGQRAFHIGTEIVKWNDPGGFNGYDRNVSYLEEVEDRKTGRVKSEKIDGKRYGARSKGIDGISQIMIHHTGGDGNGAGRVFNTLHNERGLSVHFAIDDDGMIWQFLDCKDRAWHGGKHNNVSVGIECNLYPSADKKPWYYNKDRCERFGNLPHAIGKDVIHGKPMNVFQFTAPQTEALARLSAGIWVALALLCPTPIDAKAASRFKALGKAPVFPRTHGRHIAKTAISKPLKHIGLIGHLQATRRKWDPAGFPWDYFEHRVEELHKVFVQNL